MPTPILHWQLTAFSTRQLDINAWSDLKPFKVGYERGMTIIAEHSELNLLPANSIESAILQASMGRVDVLLNDDFTTRYNLRRMGVENLIANPTPLAPGPAFHLLNSKHQKLAEQLNEVLLEMTANDRIRQIKDEVIEDFMRKAEQEDRRERPWGLGGVSRWRRSDARRNPPSMPKASPLASSWLVGGLRPLA